MRGVARARGTARFRLPLSATFRAMFNNSSLGKAQADVATYLFTRANDALCRLLGVRSTDLLSITIPDCVHPSSRPALEAAYPQLPLLWLENEDSEGEV